MKKKYIRIHTLTETGEFKTVSTFRLTGNVSAYISEAGQTRIYFINGNPFTFIRLYLNWDEFNFLFNIKHNGSASKDIKQDGSFFRYTIFETIEAVE